MGNNPSGNSTNRRSNSLQSTGVDNNSETSEAAKARMLRSPSGADIFDKQGSNLIPIEKLSKILVQKTNELYGFNGILSEVFVSNVFPRYPDLGHRLFKLLHTSSKATTVHLGQLAFRQQCERFLSILDDQIILENVVKLYSDPDKNDSVEIDGFRILLRTCFDLTMAHNIENHKTCPMIERTLNTIVSSCFFTKDLLSVGFICRWLNENCPRLVPPIYKFCVYILTSAYRGIESSDQQIGLELATPILDKTNPFEETIIQNKPLLPVSEAWLLAGSLDPLYSKPQQVNTAVSPTANHLASQVFMAKMLSLVPSHWTLLYDSMQHGVGSNRFLHHVLGYKGPTLILLRGNEDHIFCIGSPSEWRESHIFSGGDHCSIIQLFPKFNLIEKGPKMLYLNTTMRGYPKGLRAGSDPRKPILNVDEHFEKFEYRGVPYTLESIEVWGCGDKQSREIQLDIKKWQVKEAERQRTVKLTAADWMDHPDRHLLELGGRVNYNNSAT